MIAAALLLCAAAASGARFLGFSTDYRVFFSAENPQLTAFEALQDVYTKDDGMFFVVKPKTGDIFTAANLRAIRALAQAAWKIPFATRVDSLTNFQHSYAEGDNLTVRDLVPRKAELTPEAVVEIHAIALREPLLLNRLIFPDGTTVGVNVSLTLPGKSLDEGPQAIVEARRIAAEIGAANPDLRIAITGLAALNIAFSEASEADIKFLVPLMYGVLVLVMIVLLRSASATFSTVLVIGFSAATALAGWMGILLSPPSATAPTIILTIAIADSIHILVTLLHEMRGGATKREAIIESMRVNFAPVFLTSLTTAIGFLSLNFSDAPPFRDLGNITAMGVAAAWVYSITLLPALIAVLPLRVKAEAADRRRGMRRLAEFVIARKRVLFWGMTGVVLALGVVIPRIELNDQFVRYFADSIPFRVDTDFAMENLSGIYQMQYSLPAAAEGGISDPDYQARVDHFRAWLLSQSEVVHVQSLTDIMRRLNKNMHGDDEAFFRLPEDRNLAAQFLLLFEMSLPFGLDLNNQINVDKSALRLTATLRNISTGEARNLKARAAAWLTANFPTTSAAEATGPFMMFAFISKRNIEGMLVGTTIAFILISLVLVVALRNVKIGLISLVPNLVPALMTFGIWGIFVGQVGMAASVVTATSLGIIVDATVHFLSKYLRARRQRGDSPEDAIRYAFSTVGTALWVTTLILVAGFAVLALSAFQLNQQLGLLTAIAMVCALVADFLLLPPLLLALDRDKPNATELSNDRISQPAAAQ